MEPSVVRLSVEARILAYLAMQSKTSSTCRYFARLDIKFVSLSDKTTEFLRLPYPMAIVPTNLMTPSFVREFYSVSSVLVLLFLHLATGFELMFLAGMTAQLHQRTVCSSRCGSGFRVAQHKSAWFLFAQGCRNFLWKSWICS